MAKRIYFAVPMKYSAVANDGVNLMRQMTISQMLGVVATGLVIGGYVPQIVHLVKERCTAGISVPAFALWCVASLLFLIHAAMINDAVFVGVQTVNLVAGGLIVWFCKKYEGEVCPFHREVYGKGPTSH